MILEKVHQSDKEVNNQILQFICNRYENIPSLLLSELSISLYYKNYKIIYNEMGNIETLILFAKINSESMYQSLVYGKDLKYQNEFIEGDIHWIRHVISNSFRAKRELTNFYKNNDIFFKKGEDYYFCKSKLVIKSKINKKNFKSFLFKNKEHLSKSQKLTTFSLKSIVHEVKSKSVIFCNGLTEKELNSLTVVLSTRSKYFKNIVVDESKYIEANCEYYGGDGIGRNLGSGRSISLGNFNVKGVGKTPLVSQSLDIYNSTGYLPTYEALVELWIFQLFKIITPIKFIEHHAVIQIGTTNFVSSSAHYEVEREEQMPISLLVREQVERIGNYISFNDINYENKDINESRLQYNFSKLSENHDIETVISKLVNNSARMMAFAFVYRISHGALTPSNISLSGKWLDLSNTSAVPYDFDGHCGLGNPKFLDERFEMLNIIIKFVHSVNKYTFSNFNIPDIKSKYLNTLNNYIHIEITQFLGLKNLENNEDHIKKFINISSNPKMYYKGIPKDQNTSNEYVYFYTTSYSNINLNNKSPYENLKRSLKFLKSIYFRRCIYIGNLYKYSKQCVKKEKEVKNNITTIQMLSELLFKDNEYIFKVDSLKVKVADGEFLVDSPLSCTVSFRNTLDLLYFLNGLPRSSFEVIGLNFKDEVISMIKTINNTFSI